MLLALHEHATEQVRCQDDLCHDSNVGPERHDDESCGRSSLSKCKQMRTSAASGSKDGVDALLLPASFDGEAAEHASGSSGGGTEGEGEEGAGMSPVSKNSEARHDECDCMLVSRFVQCPRAEL